jgi:hypothetical protein
VTYHALLSLYSIHANMYIGLVIRSRLHNKVYSRLRKRVNEIVQRRVSVGAVITKQLRLILQSTPYQAAWDDDRVMKGKGTTIIDVARETATRATRKGYYLR